MPWWNTSQGSRPSRASTMSAMLTPYTSRPGCNSWSRRPKSVDAVAWDWLAGASMHATLKANSSGCKEPIRGGLALTSDASAAPNWPACSAAVGTSLPGRPRARSTSSLAGAVRGLLIDGRLALGVRLPAERELAAALGISRTTVTAAYRELREVRPPDQPARRRQLDRTARRPPRRQLRAVDAERRRRHHRPRLRRAARARRAAPGGRGRGRRPARVHSAAPATTRSACRSCARRSPTATPSAACPPAPSRS